MNVQKQTLTISFDGYTELKGDIFYKVVDEQGKEVVKAVATVKERAQKVSLSLPPGRYAVSAFHDANSNKKLDKNLLGMPTEKYGFSNNVRGTFGPPALEDQLVTLQGPMDIKITLK